MIGRHCIHLYHSSAKALSISLNHPEGLSVVLYLIVFPVASYKQQNQVHNYEGLLGPRKSKASKVSNPEKNKQTNKVKVYLSQMSNGVTPHKAGNLVSIVLLSVLTAGDKTSSQW